MKKNLVISCILPKMRNDYLTDTVLDGLATLKQKENIYLLFPNYAYPSKVKIPEGKILPLIEFIKASKDADLILLFNAGQQVEEEVAEKIGMWHKTFFIDGSELGRNRRLDMKIKEALEDGTYSGKGAIRSDYLNKCAAYFRREPPYLNGVTPLPFGIERKYIHYSKKTKKDIDFVCIFGQEEFPPLRKEVRLALEQFCAENNFVCKTSQTKIPFFSIHSAFAQKRFYSLLARAKVGISVCGGGFDTLRFWEILGNNCILLTEKVGVYPEGTQELNFERIRQFSDSADFKLQLNKVAEYLQNGYDVTSMEAEYKEVLDRHSTLRRVRTILAVAEEKGIL